MADGESTYKVKIDASGAQSGARSAVNAFNRVRQAVNSTNKAFSSFRESVSSSFQRMVKAANIFGKTIRNLIRPITGLKAALAATFTSAILNNIVDAGLQMQKFRTTLTVITGDVGKAGRELDWLRSTADKLGISFQNAAAPFGRFAAAASDVLDPDAIRDVFSAFAEASSALRLNQQEINGVFLALQQMASKGKVSMEELRLQLAERIPGAMRLAADSMQMTVGELEDAIRQRLISTEEFLGPFAERISQKFGTAAQVAAQSAFGAFQRLRNAVFGASSAIAEGGLIDALGRAADEFASLINDNLPQFRALGQLLGEVVNKAVEFVKSLDRQTIEAFFQSIVSGFNQVFTGFTNIANSKFFRWLTRSPEQQALAEQLNELDDQITSLYENIDSRQNGLFAWAPANQRSLQMMKEQQKELIFQRQTLLNQYNEMTQVPQLELPQLQPSQSGGSSNTPAITEQDYADQLNTIQMRINQMLDPNREINELLSRRTSIMAEMSDLQQKMNGEGEFANLTMKQRVDAAILYKGQLRELLDVESEISKINKATARDQQQIARRREQEIARQLREQEKLLRTREAISRIGRTVEVAQEQRITQFQMSMRIMSDAEKQQYDIRFQRERALFALQERYAKARIAYSGNIEALRELQAEYNRTEETINQTFDRVSEASRVAAEVTTSWQFGAQQAMQDLSDEVNNYAETTRNTFKSVFKSMEDAIVDFVMTGKVNFKDLANSIVADITRMIVKQMLFNAISGTMGGGGGGLFGNFMGSLFTGSAGGSTSLPPINASLASPFAKGAAFSNSVVREPTAFKFADGVGLMGEAGAEAIMPLTRTRGGKLGVKAEGGVGATINMGGINISTPDVQGFNNSQAEIELQIRQAVERAARYA